MVDQILAIHLGSTDLFAAPPDVIELPYDDEDVAPRPRKNKKVAAGKTSQPGLTTEPTVQQPEDAGGASMTFAVPLSSERPAPSIVPVFPSAAQPHASELQVVASGPSALSSPTIMFRKASRTPLRRLSVRLT